MTIDAANPIASYLVAGSGPYSVPWPYEGGDLAVWADKDGTITALSEGAHWTIAPASGPSGAVTLTAGAVTGFAGARLLIERVTQLEQGFSGVTGPERGIEASLDRLTRAVQDVRARTASGLRFLSTTALTPTAPLADGQTVMWQGGAMVPGPSAAQIEGAASYAASAVAAANMAANILTQVSGIADALTNKGAVTVSATGDGVRNYLEVAGTVWTKANVLAVVVGNVPQGPSRWDIEHTGSHTRIVFGEPIPSGLSAWAVLLKQNEVDIASEAQIGDLSTRSFSDRAAAVDWAANNVAVPGMVLQWGDTRVRFVNYAVNLITDLSGFVPDGLETPQHWNGGPDRSPAENDLAFAACAAWRGAIHLPPGLYYKNDPIAFDRRPGTGRQGIYLGSLNWSPEMTRVRFVNPVAARGLLLNQTGGETVTYGFNPVVVNVCLEVDTGALVNTEENWSVGLDLRQCNYGLFLNVELDGFDVGVFSRRCVQSRFDHVKMRTALRAPGNHAEAFFIFDHDPVLQAGVSFGNSVIDCECQPTNQQTNVRRNFLLRAVDMLDVDGGHYNNAVFHVQIAPDGTGGRTTVRDVSFRTYFDCDNDPSSPLIAVCDVQPIRTGAVELFGIHFFNGKARAKEGVPSNFFRFSGNEGDYAGLVRFQSMSICENEIVGFGAAAIVNLGMHASYNETELISDVSIHGNKFRDAGVAARHVAPNKNAVVVRGKNISVKGNSYNGNWTDGGLAVVTVGADVEGYLIAGEIFDTNRAIPINIDPGVTGAGQSYGHVINGAAAARVIEVLEEGTGPNGYYCKYSNGEMVCRKRVVLSAVPINTVNGSGFVSAALVVGDIERSFSGAPHWSVTAMPIGGFGSLQLGGAGDANTPPSIRIARFSPATLDVDVSIRAEGRWA